MEIVVAARTACASPAIERRAYRLDEVRRERAPFVAHRIAACRLRHALVRIALTSRFRGTVSDRSHARARAAHGKIASGSDRMVVNIKTTPLQALHVVDGTRMPGQSFLQLDETFPRRLGLPHLPHGAGRREPAA